MFSKKNPAAQLCLGSSMPTQVAALRHGRYTSNSKACFAYAMAYAYICSACFGMAGLVVHF